MTETAFAVWDILQSCFVLVSDFGLRITDLCSLLSVAAVLALNSAGWAS
jgi:hypothetical protein